MRSRFSESTPSSPGRIGGASRPGAGISRGDLSLDEAIRAYSEDAAYAAFDDRKGRIAPGFWADLTVLEKDLRAIPPEDIPSVQVTHTVVGGRVVFENPK